MTSLATLVLVLPMLVANADETAASSADVAKLEPSPSIELIEVMAALLTLVSALTAAISEAVGTAAPPTNTLVDANKLAALTLPLNSAAVPLTFPVKDAPLTTVS